MSGAESKPKRGRPPGERERDRMTIYFEPELRKRLKVYCVMNDAELSDTVAEAVAAFLDAREASKPESEKPKKRPTKKKSDEGSDT